MRALIAVMLLLVASPGWAQPDLPLPGAIRERVLLVWGGGRTSAEAEAFLEAYEARAGDWSRVLELGAGYPRIIDGAELPGLRPGYHFVALGVCEAREGKALEKVFKALEPLSYSRRVLWDESEPLACPSLLPDWSFGRSARTRVTGGTLSAVTFDHAEEGGRRGWLLILAVLRKNGEVESTVLESEEEASSEVRKLRAGRGRVAMEEWMTAPTCDVGPVAEVHTRAWFFSVKGGGFVTKQQKKLLRRAPCAQSVSEEAEEE